VSSHQPLLPTGQSWELELSFLFAAFLLEICQFQFTTSFSKVVECAVIFPRLHLGHRASTQTGSAQLFGPPLPGRGEMLLLLIWPPVPIRCIFWLHCQLSWGKIPSGLLSHVCSA
jgi:hypothetical protein